MNNRIKRFTLCLATALVVLAMASTTAIAGVAGTTWAGVPIKMQAKISGIGKYKYSDNISVRYDSDNTFMVYFQDLDYGFDGTYSEDAEGHINSTPDAGSLRDFLEYCFTRQAYEDGAWQVDIDVTVTDVVDVSTAKEKKGRIKYSLKVGIGFEVSGTMNNQSVWTTGSVAIRGKDTLDVGSEAAGDASLAGTAWDLEVIDVIKITGYGKEVEESTMELHFGPSSELGMPEGVFALLDEDIFLFGTYTEDAKGKVTMFLDHSAFEAQAAEALADPDETLWIDVQSSKLTAKVKKGILKFALKVKFIGGEVGYDDVGKAMWTLKGLGTLADD